VPGSEEDDSGSGVAHINRWAGLYRRLGEEDDSGSGVWFYAINRWAGLYRCLGVKKMTLVRGVGGLCHKPLGRFIPAPGSEDDLVQAYGLCHKPPGRFTNAPAPE
jgi:hypothetical protein